MPRFAANLSWLFTEYPFAERFAAAAEAGFGAVEYLFPYDHPAAALRQAADEHGLDLALFNTPPGDWERGDRGLACIPDRTDEFGETFAAALAYAQRLGSRGLHIMAGIRGDREAYIGNLKHACATAPEGLTLLIEPINGRDMPFYHLNTSGDAMTVLEAVGADNLKLQLDLYHAQIMEGDLARRIAALLPHIGHIQIAGVPDRHEPDGGEVNFPYLFDLLDDLGYEGFIGCEYRPRGRTEDGLGWFHRYRKGT